MICKFFNVVVEYRVAVAAGCCTTILITARLVINKISVVFIVTIIIVTAGFRGFFQMIAESPCRQADTTPPWISPRASRVFSITKNRA